MKAFLLIFLCIIACYASGNKSCEISFKVFQSSNQHNEKYIKLNISEDLNLISESNLQTSIKTSIAKEKRKSESKINIFENQFSKNKKIEFRYKDIKSSLVHSENIKTNGGNFNIYNQDNNYFISYNQLKSRKQSSIFLNKTERKLISFQYDTQVLNRKVQTQNDFIYVPYFDSSKGEWALPDQNTLRETIISDLKQTKPDSLLNCNYQAIGRARAFIAYKYIPNGDEFFINNGTTSQQIKSEYNNNPIFSKKLEMFIVRDSSGIKVLNLDFEKIIDIDPTIYKPALFTVDGNYLMLRVLGNSFGNLEFVKINKDMGIVDSLFFEKPKGDVSTILFSKNIFLSEEAKKIVSESLGKLFVIDQEGNIENIEVDNSNKIHGLIGKYLIYENTKIKELIVYDLIDKKHSVLFKNNLNYSLSENNILAVATHKKIEIYDLNILVNIH